MIFGPDFRDPAGIGAHSPSCRVPEVFQMWRLAPISNYPGSAIRCVWERWKSTKNLEASEQSGTPVLYPKQEAM